MSFAVNNIQMYLPFLLKRTEEVVLAMSVVFYISDKNNLPNVLIFSVVTMKHQKIKLTCSLEHGYCR